MGKELISLK